MLTHDTNAAIGPTSTKCHWHVDNTSRVNCNNFIERKSVKWGVCLL